MNTESFSSIDPAKIIFTAQLLRKRVYERLPASNLVHVGDELVRLANLVELESRKLSQPMILLRVGLGFAGIAFVGLILYIISSLQISSSSREVINLLQGLEAGVNILIIFGISVVFLLSLEKRLKQRYALKSLHRLRSLAHVIDLHQLTKDPERLVIDIPTPSSPEISLSSFQLGRYLDYCSEMLSIIGKLAALYIEHLHDPVVIEAGSDVEALTTSLSHKIWQKIRILHLLDGNNEKNSRRGD